MAEVPYSGGVPQVAPETRAPDDYEHIQADSSSFGGLVARGAEQFGAGASKAGQFFGQVAADSESNSFQDQATKLLHGDPNKTIIGPDGKPQQDLGYLGLRGRAALDARPGVESQLDQILKQNRENLLTPEQQLKFDEFSRRYRSYVTGQIGTHADNQANTWYKQVNDATAQLAIGHISVNADNPQQVAAGASDLIAARVKQAQLQGGGPELVNEAVATAKREALKAQLEAISVKDPARALSILDKNREIAGVDYQPLANQFRTRSDRQIGDYAGQMAILKAGAGATGVAPTGTASLPQIHSAIIYQESGGNPSIAPSINNARGIGQILPSTFAQYAKPGEHIDNPADNMAVSQRIIADYYKRFDGDPARIAVAYFSGPGNVAPAGSALPWIRDAADGNGKTTSAYVSDISRRLTGPTAIKGDAYRMVMDDPNISPEARTHALTYINRELTAQQIAQSEDVKARKAANDHAADGYVTRMLTGDVKGIVNQIAVDQNLTWETKRALGEAAEKHSSDDVESATKNYGIGFWGAYKAVTAPVGDPARISDPTQLLQRAGPDGDLTLTGVQKLMQTLQQNQKSVNDSAVNTSKVGLLNYAKSRLSFEADTGPIKIRDPKGEAIFNAQFIPKFEAAFDKWKNDGKDPWQFLTQKNVDEMLTGLRSPREMAMDRMAATGEAAPAEDPKAPLPPAPIGIDPASWSSVVTKPPATEGGVPFPRSAWANALGMLIANPTPENMKLFDQSKFGRAGYRASEVLEQLKPKSGGIEKKETGGAAGDQTKWPTNEDVVTALKTDQFYGTPLAGYMNPGDAKVRTVPIEDVPRMANKGELDGGDYKETNQFDVDRIARQSIAAQKSPVAMLGFDPRHTISSPKSDAELNISGGYTPKTDTAWYDQNDESAAVHESMHRGIKMLVDAGVIPKNKGREEYIVRALMEKYFGGIEMGGGEAGDRQIKLSRIMIEPKELKTIEDAAAALIAKKQQMGPR